MRVDDDGQFRSVREPLPRGKLTVSPSKASGAEASGGDQASNPCHEFLQRANPLAVRAGEDPNLRVLASLCPIRFTWRSDPGLRHHAP
jgi:hypothetical protein